MVSKMIPRNAQPNGRPTRRFDDIDRAPLEAIMIDRRRKRLDQ
jgi:hypothetical protein